MVSPELITLALTLAYGVAVPVTGVIYWRTYGPANFLWLSDIAFAGTFAALLTGSGLIASMIAVGVLPLEIVWTIDFLAGSRLIGLTAYMFDAKLPLYLRRLSLFHLALPPTLFFLLYRFGYDERALVYQTLLTWAIFGVTYLGTRPEQNINRVFGPSSGPQRSVPPLLYLALLMAALPVFVILPMHLILTYFF